MAVRATGAVRCRRLLRVRNQTYPDSRSPVIQPPALPKSPPVGGHWSALDESSSRVDRFTQTDATRSQILVNFSKNIVPEIVKRYAAT